LVPMFMLYHGHDEDPRMRPKPISPQQREKAILQMAAGLVGAYRYFRTEQQADAAEDSAEPQRGTSKVGRNGLCPCGLGHLLCFYRRSSILSLDADC